MTNVHENWLPIPKYEALYEISDLGRVKSLSKGGRKEKFLKPIKDKNGYVEVFLSKEGKVAHFKIHRLVIATFLEYSELTVDHINGIKDDNRLSNLRYCTLQDNTRFYYSNKKKHSKYQNVSFKRDINKWFSYVKIKGKMVFIGYYDSEDTANESVILFKKQNNII